MFNNFIRILLRGFVKRRVYTVINLLGLAIGLTSFILIMLYVRDELSFDRHYRNSDRIARVCMIYDFGGVGENSASMPFPVAYTLKSEYPDLVENVVRIFNFQSDRSLVEYEGKKFSESRFYFADSSFFEIFSQEFIKGDPATALLEPHSVVITEKMAEKYFPGEDPYGKILKYEVNLPLKVTGVVKEPVSQTHFRFDFIASLSTMKKVFNGRLPQTWVWNPCWTYILMPEGAQPARLEEKFPAFIQKYYYDAQRESIVMYLQKLTDIHLHSRIDYEIRPNSNYMYVVVLSAIAVFLLLIAAINFMNLATATAGSRAREIGIRKVTGADRMRLIGQFLGESLAMTLLAFILALILIQAILPSFNDLTGKDIQTGYLADPINLAWLAGLWLLLGLLSGAYPALFLSSFKPIAILKPGLFINSRSGLPRKILVVFQFTISIGLILSTMMIFRQVNFLRNAEMGFDPENIIMVRINQTKVSKDFETFRNELIRNPNIESVTALDDIIGESHNTHEFWFEGMKEKEWRFFPALVVRYDFLQTFGIELVAGRDYNRENKTDPEQALLVNEALVKHMGWSSNDEALGKRFHSLNGDEKIVGVFRDFQPTSFREPAGPFILNMKEKAWEINFFMKYAAIRTTGKNNAEAIRYIESKWSEFEKEKPFDYFMLKDELKRLYNDERNLGNLAVAFTFLILFVAAMGLFGLASFMAEKRTKEIGIRKVMGASVFDILMLLQREFTWLIVIAMVIAWPVSYFLVDSLFLQQFALRVPFNIWVFLLSGFFALAISLLIISYRALKASLINPVETLKYE
ncbi:MAG TPA: ABC transporter permease [Bacteroidales bacterium]|nr:ABC transporter permease [Bacteroidales bacterium]HPI85518.1 ABC transporter permease [Bacteroidales bacterium]